MLHTRGIVIRTLKYGETSVIADILTAEKGLCTFIGGNVRAAKSRMPYSLFQSLTVVDMVSYWKDDYDALHRLKECRAGWVWTGIPFDLKKGAVALFIAEVLRKCLHNGDKNDALYEWLMEVLQTLDTATGSVAHLHLWFMAQLPEFMGFQMQWETEIEGVFYFDLKEGELVAAPPHHGQYMNAGDTQHLLQLLQAPLADALEFTWPHTERKSLLTKLLLYYQFHVPGFDEIHTPAVLEMVMR